MASGDFDLRPIAYSVQPNGADSIAIRCIYAVCLSTVSSDEKRELFVLRLTIFTTYYYSFWNIEISTCGQVNSQLRKKGMRRITFRIVKKDR